MNGYTKLFGSLVGSTIWREPDHVRIVWITMLALKNRFDVVEASLPGLADFARVSIAKCEEALKVLMAPDKYSRSKEHEGRRIEEVDGGWVVLNGEKYRTKMSLDERREANRIYQQNCRDRKKKQEEEAKKLGKDEPPKKPKPTKYSPRADDLRREKGMRNGELDSDGLPIDPGMDGGS